ncbi:MAG: polysaccharide deacetylase family protein [Desulfobacter postgatei]|nr:polysaccharide deacetylase family protein [Desulfobacter postgatei]
MKKPDELPQKTIILTFDDGFANNFEGAYLPLKERNMCATWFIVSGCVGSYSTWLKEVNNEKMLTIEQLLEMNANGMEIGSHTVSHRDLTILNEKETHNELTSSKTYLEKIINTPVVSFAYPYGRFGDLAANCAKKAGYSFACSVRPGLFNKNEDPFRIPRVTIFSHDSLGTFARKLIFASNEMSWKQMIRYYNSRLISQLKKRISFSRE